MSHRTAPPSGAAQLRADCGRCFGLCCVVPAFAASTDFAIDKPAGRPCPNLGTDYRCGIHTELRQRGFPGCTVFDCFGAGQQVAQVTFAGRDWRDAPETLPAMFAAFAVLRPLHELLWYLTEALALRPPADLRAELDAPGAETLTLTEGTPRNCARSTSPTTGAGSTRCCPRPARRPAPPGGVDRRGAHLLGADLRRVDLRGANLRGACSSAPTCAARTSAWPTSPARTYAGPTCGARTCGTPSSCTSPSWTPPGATCAPGCRRPSPGRRTGRRCRSPRSASRPGPRPAGPPPLSARFRPGRRRVASADADRHRREARRGLPKSPR